MRTIIKFDLPLKSRFNLDLPKDSEIIAVKVQQNKSLANLDKPVMWAVVDTNAEKTSRRFWLYMNESTIPSAYSEWSKLEYIDTFTIMDKDYHMFEEDLDPKHLCR